MATEPPEDDVLELGEAPEDLDEQPPELNDEAEQPEDVELPTFGDVGEEEDTDTELVKHLRAQVRERDRKLKEVTTPKVEPEIVIGDEPIWNEEDAGEAWDYSGPKFAAAHREWEKRKEAAEAKANQQTEAQRKQNETWQARVNDFAQKRAVYPANIMTDCETAVATTFSEEQRRAIIRYATNPAAMVVALGRSQAKMDTLAKIEDIGDFIAETARLEKEMKVKGTRRPTAQPDTPVRGSAALSASSVDKELERLEKEADRTNDRSKIIAYKAKKAA